LFSALGSKAEYEGSFVRHSFVELSFLVAGVAGKPPLNLPLELRGRDRQSRLKITPNKGAFLLCKTKQKRKPHWAASILQILLSGS
jgi:hypothetical protein